MNSKKNQKNIFGNKILLNILLIIGAGLAFLILLFLFLNVYTRHGQNVIVPDLHELQVNEARTLLKSKGLKIEVIDSIYRKEAVPGSIIEQTPKAKNKVKEGRAIYLIIYAQNPQQIAVPGLVDYSERQAIALLNSLGFDDIIIEEVPSQYQGLVISVEYRGKRLNAEEKIPAGSPLKLVVGSGAAIDSLSMNQEYIVSPENVRRESRDSTRHTTDRESNMDESFF